MNELAATVLVLAVAEVVAVGDPCSVGPGQKDPLATVVDEVCALYGHPTSCTGNTDGHCVRPRRSHQGETDNITSGVEV